jgi:predicted XRE-type DNA-binding protein
MLAKQIELLEEELECTVRAKRLHVDRRIALLMELRRDADCLRKIRTGAGATQTQVAQLAQVPQSYVSYFEDGSIEKLSEEALLRVLRVYEEMSRGDEGSR